MAPPAGFPAHVLALQADLQTIAQNLRARFPNLRICYLSSRTYGGYAFNPDRKEPLSFETGFAVQRLIAAQIAGDPALNHDPAHGLVLVPWLAWGPYLWADGAAARCAPGSRGRPRRGPYRWRAPRSAHWHCGHGRSAHPSAGSPRRGAARDRAAVRPRSPR
jgi:hypothetical protein